MPTFDPSSTELTGDRLRAAAELELRERNERKLRAHTKQLEAWRADFVSFAAELDVIDKFGKRVPIRPSGMIRTYERERTWRDVVLKPRQVWFTTWELARDLWHLVTNRAVGKGAVILCMCQSDAEDTAVDELERRVEVMLGTDLEARQDPNGQHGLLGKHPWLRDLLVREAGEWVCGLSRFFIIGAGASAASAAKKGRAGTVARAHLTEISSWEHAAATMTALQPTIFDGNKSTEVVIESTARGASGEFYERYHKAKAGRSSYRAHFLSWMRHEEYRAPLATGERIKVETAREKELVRKHKASAEQVKWYRAKVSDMQSQDQVDQEFPMDEETCWLVAGRLFLDVAITKKLLTETIEPRRVEKLRSSVPDPAARNALLVWEEPIGRDDYLVIADPSEGVVDGDPSAAAIFHRASGRHVASVHGLWRTHEFAGVLKRVGRFFNNAWIVVERVNHGHAVLNALLGLTAAENDLDRDRALRDAYPHVWHDPEDQKPGWKTGTIQRATAMERFEAAHRSGEWTSPDREALGEMLTFIIDKRGKPVGAPGAHDDRVLTHVIGWTILSMPASLGTKVVSGSGSRWGSDERGFG